MTMTDVPGHVIYYVALLVAVSVGWFVLLGLARRAGQAVSGWQAAREWLQAGRAGLLVQAADGSLAERARFGGRDLPAVTPLTAVELGVVFGRDHAVHVVVAPGRLAEAIRIEAERLAGFAIASPEQA